MPESVRQITLAQQQRHDEWEGFRVCSHCTKLWPCADRVAADAILDACTKAETYLNAWADIEAILDLAEDQRIRNACFRLEKRFIDTTALISLPDPVLPSAPPSSDPASRRASR